MSNAKNPTLPAVSYSPTETINAQKLADARTALTAAAWEVQKDWWPDSPHTVAILSILQICESILDTLST